MNTYRRGPDAAALPRPRRGALGPALRALAALSTTLAMLLALLPTPDAAAVQQALATTTTTSA